MRRFDFLTLICLLVCCCFGNGDGNGIKPVSFTANGVWSAVDAADSDSTCGDKLMCTPSKKTWKPSYKHTYFNNVTACDALVAKGITKIFFHGDSYVRQIYAALLITLNGDYKYGSQANAEASPQCSYHKQFNEKSCGTRQLNHYGKVCNNRVILDPILAGFSNDNHCTAEKGTVVVWSFGNYKLQKHGRHGVNNATAYQAFFENDVCPLMRGKKDSYTGVSGSASACSVYWISTHYRVKAYFDDEQPQLVKKYNEEMRAFYDAGGCGNVNYVDVYNMTASLALEHTDEAAQMTYDGVHWGYEVNLIKAQIILNALIASASS